MTVGSTVHCSRQRPVSHDWRSFARPGHHLPAHQPCRGNQNQIRSTATAHRQPGVAVMTKRSPPVGRLDTSRLSCRSKGLAADCPCWKALMLQDICDAVLADKRAKRQMTGTRWVDVILVLNRHAVRDDWPWSRQMQVPKTIRLFDEALAGMHMCTPTLS